jgi:hypothetical protein
LESLTERILPASYVWTGDNRDGLVSSPLNWRPIGVPTNGDSLTFNGNAGPNSNNLATFDQLAPGHLASLSITGTYFWTVTLAKSLEVTNLLVAARGMGANGRIHVNAGCGLSIDQGTISAGEITGPGSFSVNVGNAPVFNITGQCAISTSSWNIIPAATVNISAVVSIGCNAVAQEGIVNWTEGWIGLGPGTLTNTGQFKAKCDEIMLGNGTFNNLAEFRKEVGGGVTEIDVTFNGVGVGASIQVINGTVEVAQSGNDSGTIHVAPGATKFTWTGDRHTIRTVQGSVTLTGKRVEHKAILRVPNGSTLISNLTDLVLSGSDTAVVGPGTVTLLGRLLWEEGMFQTFPDNRLSISGVVDITTGGNHVLEGVQKLALTGDTNWQSGPISLNDSVVENYGTLDILCDSIMGDPGGATPSRFENKPGGTVTKTGGAFPTKTTISVFFLNAGDLFLNGETIRFNKELRQDSGKTDLSNGTLEFGPQAYFHVTGGLVGGAGTIDGRMSFVAGTLLVEAGDMVTVTGDYSQFGQAKLIIQFAGNQLGGLNVQGTATLGGSLTVDGGNNLPPGIWLPVMTAGSLVGSFDVVMGVVAYEYDRAGTPNKVSVRG